MKTLEEIIKHLRRVQPDLRRRYPIGNWVSSDRTFAANRLKAAIWDILVNLDDGIGLFELAGLQQDLSDALGIKVDLVMKDALKRGIGRRILSEAVML